jgi:hypothetical protein
VHRQKQNGVGGTIVSYSSAQQHTGIPPSTVPQPHACGNLREEAWKVPVHVHVLKPSNGYSTCIALERKKVFTCGTIGGSDRIRLMVRVTVTGIN